MKQCLDLELGVQLTKIVDYTCLFFNKVFKCNRVGRYCLLLFGSSMKRHTQMLAKTCLLSCLSKQLIQDNYCSLQKALQA